MASSNSKLQVNETLIQKVADLSRLDLTSDEVSEYSKSISEILTYVEQLQSLDTTQVEPMIHGIDGALRFRADEVKPFGVDSEGKPKILSSAPEVQDDGLKVPPIL